MASLVSGNPEPPEGLEDHVAAAKSCLLTSNGRSITMYDHLVEIMRQVLENKSDNVDNLIKDISRNEKKCSFLPDSDTIQEKKQASKQYALATEQKSLFQRRDIAETVSNSIVQDGEEEEGDGQLGLSLPDIMENAYFFELGSVGLGREETLRTFLAIKQLNNDLKLKSCRFWGKILGIQQNYIIAEVEFHENEDLHWKDEHIEESQQFSSTDDLPSEDDLPKAVFKPPVDTPKEAYGEGCNSKVYFVCNDAGLPWIRLPPVTPKQIQVARKIRKFLTGDLRSPIVSYPPFPGNEINYLRAQIARISSATHISPQGYYIFEEEEEEEDDEQRTAIIPDVEYEPIPVNDLCDASLSSWVHHTQYILPQGRTSWVDPNATPSKAEEEEAEEEEESDDEREEPDDVEPEEGLPLLTPLSEDDPVNKVTAWSVVKSTSHFTQYAIAALHSNRWPGAHTFAYEKKLENIYIGYGLKYEPDNFNPQMPPALQEEYPSGPDITEAEDPTVEQERAVLAAQKEAMEEEEEEDESDDYDEENE